MKMWSLLLIVMAITVKAGPLQQPPAVPNRGAVLIGTPEPEGVYGKIDGEVVRETPHFQIYAEHGFVPVDSDWLQKEVEDIYSYLIERMGVPATERFALTFRPPDTRPCPVRGLARYERPVAQAIIFADQQTSRAQLSGVLAHEIAHLFHERVLKIGMTNTNLTEGMGTWGAGKYWQAWQGTPTESVRGFRRAGRYSPLDLRDAAFDAADADCLRSRDLRYNEWAAFIDFLISDYGMDKFRQLLGPGREPQGATGARPIMSIGPASNGRPPIIFAPAPNLPPAIDFKAVYGLSLPELEKVWLEKLDKM